MKRSLIVPALLLATFGACKDNVAPNPVVAIDITASVSRTPDGAVTIPVGGTVQLTATPKGGGGVILTDREVTWTSSNPGVAQVNPATGSVTTVTGVAPGAATITAQSEDAVAKTEIRVTAPVATACEAGPFLNLAVGQVHMAAAGQGNLLCINAGSEGAEYTLVPFNAASTSGSLALEVTAAGITPAAGPPHPFLGAASTSPSLQTFVTDLHSNAESHHLRLRRVEGQLFASHGPAARAVRAGGVRPSRSLVAAEPNVGDRLRLNVNADSACARPIYTTGRVAAVTQHAIVVADTANPSGGFTDEEYRSFGVAFDTLAYPVNVDNFGRETDIDNNGKVIIFYTRAVNQMTRPESEGFVGGFFYGRDLLPRAAIPAQNYQGCEGSNEAEMFYMRVPEPGRQNFEKEDVQRGTIATIGHEFQHLI
ncbi:MAG: Ig-like domain-containing protein, partial [Gemmatimonadota bacterium]|nr:Ig-like domain-containing protein [Gemmatimonadota bacterium]